MTSSDFTLNLACLLTFNMLTKMQIFSYVCRAVFELGSSTVSDVHFGHFSHAMHPGIESGTTFSCHIL